MKRHRFFSLACFYEDRDDELVSSGKRKRSQGIPVTRGAVQTTQSNGFNPKSWEYLINYSRGNSKTKGRPSIKRPERRAKVPAKKNPRQLSCPLVPPRPQTSKQITTPRRRERILCLLLPVRDNDHDLRFSALAVAGLHFRLISIPAPSSGSEIPGTTYFLLNLEAVNDGRELGQNLVGFLVKLKLRGDEICQVAQGLGSIKDLVSLD